MISETRPEKFDPRFEIATCICLSKGEILLLQRQDKDTFPNHWCFPGGTIHIDENSAQTVKREIKEETGIDLNNVEHRFLTTAYASYPEYDFIEHVFFAELSDRPQVTVNPREHKDFQWVRQESLKHLKLLPDVVEV